MHIAARLTIIALTLGTTTTAALMSACGQTKAVAPAAYESQYREYQTVRADRFTLEQEGWHPIHRVILDDGATRWFAWREKE